ncbi:MAG: hypothetical protein SH856_00035 [Flavobacteriales bacterium]|nr:hypothetical protein [Flavobacteriales bacterium]
MPSVFRTLLKSSIALLFMTFVMKADAQIEVGEPQPYGKQSPVYLWRPFETDSIQKLRSSSILTSYSANEREWPWQFVGPAVQPQELNPGGRAIPTYAIGRGNGTGRMNFFLVHPKKRNWVWACSPTGGLWYSRNEGEFWLEGGTDRLPISGASSVTINTKKKKQWVLATGDGDDVFMYTNGVWRTKDEGRNWENINGKIHGATLPFGDNNYSYIGKVAASPDDFNFIVVASSLGLFATENGRAPADKIKWVKISDGYFYDIEFVPGNKKFFGQRENFKVFASGSKFMMSENSGALWSTLPLPEYEEKDRYKFLRLSIELSTDDPNYVFAGVTCSEGITQSPAGEGTFQKFNLTTNKWEFVRSLKKDMNNLITTRARAITVSPIDADHVLTTNVQPVYYSHDGGQTFLKSDKGQMHDDVHHFEFSPDGKTVWAAHDGGVSLSYDGGLHWLNRDNGIGAANVFGLSVAQTEEPQVLYGGYDVGGNLLKDNKWYHVSWGDGFETIIHPENPDIMFATKQNGSLDKSVNGKDFESAASPSGTKTEWHTWIKMHPTKYNTIYCAGSSLVRSTDLGVNWEIIFEVKKFGENLKNVYRFYHCYEHPGVMYLYVLTDDSLQPEIWRTFNVNEIKPELIIWEKVADIPQRGWISGIIADPDSPWHFWLLFATSDFSGKLWYFDGFTYKDETTNLGSALVGSAILQRGSERRIYLGSNSGVFTRKAGETSWTLLDGLPGTFINSLDINYKTREIFVGTFGRGVWKGPLYEN